MKRRSCLVFVLILATTFLGSAQDLRLPRDPDKLIDRVQTFWMAMTTNQRYKAVEFVLPEKRNLFLSGSAMPVLRAKVAGLDFTTNPDEALIRISMDVFAKESSSGFLTWTVTDPWIWKDGIWYFNMQQPPDIFPRTSGESTIDTKKIQAQIEKDFQLLQNPIDLGRLLDRQHLSVEVPIKYTGKLPLSLDIGLPNPLIGLKVLDAPITSQTRSFTLVVGTDAWDGPFTLPLPLKIRYESVTVERTLTVKGNVFVPLAFRQSPADPQPDRNFSVFVRNNTDEASAIRTVVVDNKMDLVKFPKALPPHGEAELVFKPHPNETPDQLYITLETPLEGRSSYTYRFPDTRR
jgi:hypothetical protein